ncbi:uncharacterized protein LOC117174109 isoform X3 [Belonocnema kinseyi]|uniref:uncharacterized protein LOC117174109 isoform X3 n=1 Tax=Belonocnema kinseyi TaxID=2817044 RepID=UPI00143CC23C|nr:uncharacterized protein LOC117174109 isoform X3 [Belonocnema kinseyi]
MTSVTAVPDSLSATYNMIPPKGYHLQQGLAHSSASLTLAKNHQTLSKGKKSWSVRLGLSRQSQSPDDLVKGWGTISGGSALSHQMIYEDPWLYGTVRASRSGQDPRAFLTSPPSPGAPILILCSCPEFLSGSTRKLSNCWKCGDHRLGRIPYGGTCRLQTTPARTRASLAGILRPSVDDPYDQMRRNCLIEPRSRARSISPHRQIGQRDTRSQCFMRGSNIFTQEPSFSRIDCFNATVNFNETDCQKPHLSNMNDQSSDIKNRTDHRMTSGRLIGIKNKLRNIKNDGQKSSPQTSKNTQRKSVDENWKDTVLKTTLPSSAAVNDSRKSILECHVNPYLLVKKRNKAEDDLSDDLSENSLEHDETLTSHFDSSKVKSIDRITNPSSVAAIGGQRIKVFNEHREVFDEGGLHVTRLPIPKMSPKRPSRRIKEAKNVLRSILKKDRCEGKKKNVLFNVDNVIFAPEKPPEISASRRTSRSSIGGIEPEEVENTIVLETQIIEERKFITIPNIKDPLKQEKLKLPEARILPILKSVAPIDRIKVDKIVPFRQLETLGNKDMEATAGVMIESKRSQAVLGMRKVEQHYDKKKEKKSKRDDERIGTAYETELEIEIDELKPQLSNIPIDGSDLILKSKENLRQSYLTRSQSECSNSRTRLYADDTGFIDGMRVSIFDRAKEIASSKTSPNEIPVEVKGKAQDISTPVATKKSQEKRTVEFSTYQATKKTDEAIKDLPTRAEEQFSFKLDSKNPTKLIRNLEHFCRMRPTSGSPPPGKAKHLTRDRHVSGPGTTELECYRRVSSVARKNIKDSAPEGFTTSSTSKRLLKESDKIVVGEVETNVCKITVSPRASRWIHRLQIGSDISSGSSKTSIFINGDVSDGSELNNKVTISVGGEESVFNPTVISVNSNNSEKIQDSSRSRTLVILENYKSNIVVKSISEKEKSKISEGLVKKSVDIPLRDENQVFEASRRSKSSNHKLNCSNYEEETCRSESESQIQDLVAFNSWSTLSKESFISELFEDSLRKVRENCKIIDESSGEAILKILKQNVLKSKVYESSKSTLETENYYSRSSGLNSESDFISKNIFINENPYEVIKEPIYEEIVDEPPSVPMCPPPTEDSLKDMMYLGDKFKEAYHKKPNAGQFLDSYLSDEMFKKISTAELGVVSHLFKTPEGFFNKASCSSDKENLSTKFELLHFLINSKDHIAPAEEDEDEEKEEQEDAERELEALYEQKETSLGDLSSKSSQISNVSDSSEDCNIILMSSPENLKARTVEIERTDSGVGSESSQASSSRRVVCRRFRSRTTPSNQGSLISNIPQIASKASKWCEDCEQRFDSLLTESGIVYASFICRKCSKKRAERKEIITEIVETEQKYGRDLKIILEEFHRPMLRAGLLTPEQLSAIFLNVEQLLEHNHALAEKLKDAVEFAQESGDEDLVTVDVGKIFLESERMLHAFENYCTRQGGGSLLLQNLEKEKELLRIFLKVSQMENTVLRRMNLNSFLMVPVQRVTKYPLLLARLLKATPSIRSDTQEAKKRLKQAHSQIELHLEHMNAEAKDVTSTKLWRRISIIQNGRRCAGEQDMEYIKLRKMAVEVLEWAHEEARFVLEGRLLIAQPSDNNWRRGRTVKLAPVTAMLVTNGKPNKELPDLSDDSLLPKQNRIKEATLLLVKEKIGRYSLLRGPLYLNKCIVCCEVDLEDYFEIQEISSKETFIFKEIYAVGEL